MANDQMMTQMSSKPGLEVVVALAIFSILSTLFTACATSALRRSNSVSTSIALLRSVVVGKVSGGPLKTLQASPNLRRIPGRGSLLLRGHQPSVGFVAHHEIAPDHVGLVEQYLKPIIFGRDARGYFDIVDRLSYLGSIARRNGPLLGGGQIGVGLVGLLQIAGDPLGIAD